MRTIGYLQSATALTILSATAIVLSVAPGHHGYGAGPGQPSIPKISPVRIEVKEVAGSYVPIGSALVGGAKLSAPVKASNPNRQTIVITLTAIAPQGLEDLKVRYRMFKVQKIIRTNKQAGAPMEMAKDNRFLSMKFGERQDIVVQGDLSRTKTHRDEYYGYIVQVVQGGQVLAEKVKPDKIHNDVKVKW